jgi:lysophospholipase L1-like esterase
MVNNNRPRYCLIGLLLISLAVAVYFNRAYAHIYKTLGVAGLKPVDYTQTYYLNNMVKNFGLVYVSLGDSLTAGVGADNYQESYPYLLATKLGGPEQGVVLKDYSLTGAKTSDLLKSLLPAAVSSNPDIVTLLIGVNDIHNQVSLNDFRNNYEQILDRLTAETTARVYAVSIPFIGADNLMLPPYQFYFDYQTKRFNAVIKELATKYGVEYLDLYTPTLSLFKKSGRHYSADLFHPSAAGYKIWAEIIYDNIHK